MFDEFHQSVSCLLAAAYLELDPAIPKMLTKLVPGSALEMYFFVRCSFRIVTIVAGVEVCCAGISFAGVSRRFCWCRLGGPMLRRIRR